MWVFENIDTFIVEKIFQKVGDWWSEQTGMTCWTLVTIFMWLASSAFLVSVILAVNNPDMLLLKKIYHGILLGTQSFMLILTLSIYEKRYRDREESEGRVMSPLRLFVPHGIIRIALLFLFGARLWNLGVEFSTHAFTSGIGAFCWVAALYFQACAPKSKPPMCQMNRRHAHVRA